MDWIIESAIKGWNLGGVFMALEPWIKKSEYESHYNPNKLFSIPRKAKRDEIGVPDVLPFVGHDTWNHYEVSWLDQKGKPRGCYSGDDL